MSSSVPSHIQGLLTYLSRPHEKANEDLALTYFRKVFGASFTRQADAQRADGYVAGSFVLELKGRSRNWLSGLFQGLAYKNRGLDFSQIIVAANTFLAVWRVDDLDESIREQVALAKGAPNSIGAFFAKKYSRQAKDILKRAAWRAGVELGSLFSSSDPDLVIAKIAEFEKTLGEGRKVRHRVTLKNFIPILKEMKQYFDPDQPVKAVRAFYSMVYAWKETSTLRLSERRTELATLEGETITNLLPSKRRKFKDFVDDHYVHLEAGQNTDDFFARYDEALDVIDPKFRVKNGIFFTDRELSKFVMWLVKQHVPNLGRNYLVIDPACGSGNLVTNWRSPLELRHKVVSEIEPELLFAVEKRMKGDQWHNGKFTVVPKTSENRGLNFLDKSAEEYLQELRTCLEEKGQKPDKPLAFLCNPPYRSDDDQAADKIKYTIHPSIEALTGKDASSERYCCFLAQMKLICQAARSTGLPDESRLLLFTKSAWLTQRTVFSSIRSQMFESFECLTGILVNGAEFFDVKGKWPIAFTVWSYNSKNKKLDSHRSIPLIDLTWLTKEELLGVPWNDPDEIEKACKGIMTNKNSTTVELGRNRVTLKTWSGSVRRDFMRNKRKSEKTQRTVGGLPAGDHRHTNKKAYGESTGDFIGFMDDLTPCRIEHSEPDRPWLRLNNQFMDLKKNRCFSGPPTHFGYYVEDLNSAKKLFFWYALTRTLLDFGYPMWVDADDLWEPHIPTKLERSIYQSAFAIAYAENECVETRFPANNPVRGLPELNVRNPLSPLNDQSFWLTTMRPYCNRAPSGVIALIDSVDELFAQWRRTLNREPDLCMSRRAYMLDDSPLTLGAGIVQIKDYAKDADDQALLRSLSQVQEILKSTKRAFFEVATSKSGLNYFGAAKKALHRVPTLSSAVEPQTARRKPQSVTLHPVPKTRRAAS